MPWAEYPWASDFSGQRSIKYASLPMALGVSKPITKRVIHHMIIGEHRAPLVDVKFWDQLLPGDVPGVGGWHWDVWNDPVKGKYDHHKIYILGAKCRTEFESGFIDENAIHCYTGADRHRISPAKAQGCRIMIRCSWTTLRPQNLFIDPNKYIERPAQ